MINSPGVNEFIDLKDAPNSYAGQATKVVKVNAGETAVEFGTGGAGGATWGSITGTLSAQTDLQTALDGKVDENVAITGATNTKITYDAKGLVTSGTAATTADINDSSNRRYVTDAQLVVIGNTSGTNTGDQTTIVGITGTKAQFDTAVTDGNFVYTDAIGVSVQGYTSVLANTTASFTTAQETKLAGIQAGAEVNVNADWNAVSGDAQILNKPTISGSNTGDVTLSGIYDYITISGQTITRGQIDLTTDVTGDLPFSNLAQGSARSVLGVTGNATADVASIQGTTDQVLRVDTAGTGLSFGTVATGGITNAAVTYAKIQNVAANSFLANATGSSATVQEIATNRIPLFGSAITGTPSSTTYLRGDGTWTAPSGSGDVVGPASATDNAIARFDLTTGKLLQNSSVTISDGGDVNLAAGTTGVAPIRFTSGTNLTSAAAGALEYDGTQYYKTIDTTSGRGRTPVEQYFRLTATGGTISTIADYFGANSGISLVSGADYLIEAELFFLKTTAGTVTWTLTNTVAPTSMNVMYRASVATGISGSGVATYLDASIYNSTSASPTIVTASLTSAVNHWASFKIFLRNNTGTSFKIRATCSAGTITPGIGSFYRAQRLPSANIGTFAA